MWSFQGTGPLNTLRSSSNVRGTQHRKTSSSRLLGRRSQGLRFEVLPELRHVPGDPHCFRIVFLLFYLAFRAPTVVPGKLQTMMELGGDVRPRARSRSGSPSQDADRFLPLLASFFFFILIGNLFEVIRGSASPRTVVLAFPLTLAIIAWLTYNGVGHREARVLRLPEAHASSARLPPCCGTHS